VAGSAITRSTFLIRHYRSFHLFIFFVRVPSCCHSLFARISASLSTISQKPLKPNGSPPLFDFDEYKDSFELWQRQRIIFLPLSSIDTALPKVDCVSYKANFLLSCLSKPILQAICTMGLSNVQLCDPDDIIDILRERWNAGRNCHVCRQQLALRIQLEKESLDSWVCELRDLAQIY
jgi:hypothetical protein